MYTSATFLDRLWDRGWVGSGVVRKNRFLAEIKIGEATRVVDLERVQGSVRGGYLTKKKSSRPDLVILTY